MATTLLRLKYVNQHILAFNAIFKEENHEIRRDADGTYSF